MPSTAASAALARAASLDPATLPLSAASDSLPAGLRAVCVGDPQAPAETFFELLAVRGLLGEDGWLVPGVHLVSLGDHFDFGPPARRGEAALDGLKIFSWLCAQPPAQVTVLLGNHDLARVCELGALDDEAFQALQREADAAYRGGDVDEAAEAAFLARHPSFPTSELLARDYSAFLHAQRVLVERALRARRARLAVAAESEVLLIHAGVTVDDVRALGAPSDAPGLASALNAFLDARLATWRTGPLELGPLHLAGDAALGEGRGILYHRPADPGAAPEDAELFEGPPRRRFDPRALPPGLTQVIGHIRDKKCRQLMPRWVTDDGSTPEGALRHLRVHDGQVRYASSLAAQPRGAAAELIFCDGGMSHVPPERYALLELPALAAR